MIETDLCQDVLLGWFWFIFRVLGLRMAMISQKNKAQEGQLPALLPFYVAIVVF